MSFSGFLNIVFDLHCFERLRLLFMNSPGDNSPLWRIVHQILPIQIGNVVFDNIDSSVKVPKAHFFILIYNGI